MNFGINANDAAPIAGVFLYTGGYTPPSISFTGVLTTLSGALTANVYKELYSYTGAGRVGLLQVATTDTTSRTVGLKVVIDGTTFYDEVSAATTTSSAGCPLIGSGGGYDTQPFYKSISISVKSSLSETDKLKLGLRLVKVA